MTTDMINNHHYFLLILFHVSAISYCQGEDTEQIKFWSDQYVFACPYFHLILKEIPTFLSPFLGHPNKNLEKHTRFSYRPENKKIFPPVLSSFAEQEQNREFDPLDYTYTIKSKECIKC